MPTCAGPPYTAKSKQCEIGFGDDMFCPPCEKAQREYRQGLSSNEGCGKPKTSMDSFSNIPVVN